MKFILICTLLFTCLLFYLLSGTAYCNNNINLEDDYYEDCYCICSTVDPHTRISIGDNVRLANPTTLHLQGYKNPTLMKTSCESVRRMVLQSKNSKSHTWIQSFSNWLQIHLMK